MMSMLFIVTGANGHLGNTICRLLKNQNQDVRGFILPSDSDKMLKELGVEVYKGDVRKIDSMEPLFDLSKTKYTYDDVAVLHTAGIVSIARKKNPLLVSVNVTGTKNITDLCLKYGVHRYIYVSSVHAIPELENQELIHEIGLFNPDAVVGSYAKTKAEATQYVLDSIQKGLKGIVVHPSGIIGPNDYGRAHMTMMMEDYLNGHLTSRINGAYDFVDVRDVAGAIVQSVYSGEVGACYILSGHRITLKDLFERMKKISGKKLRINVLPMWFAKITAPMAELYYRMRKLPPIYTSYSLYTLESNSNFSREKARIDLNYQPRLVDETIIDTMKWLVEAKRIKPPTVIKFIQSFTHQKE
jgi:dihydroflavonol-4-reductase